MVEAESVQDLLNNSEYKDKIQFIIEGHHTVWGETNRSHFVPEKVESEKLKFGDIIVFDEYPDGQYTKGELHSIVSENFAWDKFEVKLDECEYIRFNFAESWSDCGKYKLEKALSYDDFHDTCFEK